MNAQPQLITRYAWCVVRRPWLVLVSVTCVSLLLGLGAIRIRVEVDPDRELPPDHPYIRASHDVERRFGEKNLVMIGLRENRGDAFSPAFLRKVQEITNRISQLPGAILPLLQSVASPSSQDIRMAPDGLRVEPLMARPPADIPESLALKRRVFDNPSFVGTLVSYDASTLAIYATFDLTAQMPGYVNLHRAVVDILQATADGSFSYFLSGPVVIVASLSNYASQVAYFFPLALCVIGLIHYDAFRTWQAVVLPLLTGILAVVWGLGLMGYVGIPLDPLNSTTPVLILAVGAGHAIQILKRYYEELGRVGDNDTAIVESIAHVGGVMIAAGSIAALSFLSLATLGTDSMRTFGIFTAFGIVSALFIELTMVPAMRAVLPAPRQTDWIPGHESHRWLGTALYNSGQKLTSTRSAIVVLVTYAAIVATSMALAQRIEIDTSFTRNFSQGDPVRTDDDTLNRLFAGTNTLLFTVEGPSEGSIADPSALRGIDRFERHLETLPGVGKAISFVDTLRQLHKVLAAKEPLGELPETRELAIQYLFLYTLSGGNDLASRVTPDNRMAKLTIMLHEDSTRYGNEIIARAVTLARQDLPPDYTLHVAGTLASNSALTETMVRGKLLNVLQICIITIIIAGIVFRSWLAALLVAVPLAIAVLINFGAMGALGIRLDVATSAVTAMAVGIGADYAVYFLFRIREEYAAGGDVSTAVTRALLTSGRAILFVSTAVGLGYSVLCLSGFRLFVQLGGLVGLAMVTSSLATLLAVPALLSLIADTQWIGSVLGVALNQQEGHAPTHRSARTPAFSGEPPRSGSPPATGC